MTSLLRDILSSLDSLCDVSKERKIAVVRAMIEEFHLLYKELSLTMTNSEEVVRDLLSPSAVADSSQQQVSSKIVIHNWLFDLVVYSCKLSSKQRKAIYTSILPHC